MNTLDALALKGKTVLMRVDFNVPIKNGNVEDDTRIRATLPSIQEILTKGGKLVLLSHLGRPQKDKKANGKIKKDKYSLAPVAQHLSSLLNKEVTFSDETIGPKAEERVKKLGEGEVIIMENTRFHKGEKSGDEDFAKALSRLGDLYVNDAFGAAHREHASTSTVAKFFDKANKGAGFLLQKEIEQAEKALKEGKRPFIAIIGGAKVSDKIDLIGKMIEKADHIIIGGGMAFTFIKAKDGKVGNSLVEEDKLKSAKQLIQEAIAEHTEIHLPEDSVIADDFAEDANYKVEKSNNIPDGWMGLDIGPQAVRAFSKVIAQGETIIWNGPMGVFEMEAFSNGTFAIAEAVADATVKGAYSLVGGGDSVSAVNKSGKSGQISHISTGGGALLEYLEGKTLPGIAALEGD